MMQRRAMNVVLGCALLIGQSAWAVDIQWSVLDRFPLFRDADAFQRIADHWPSDASAATFVDTPGFASTVAPLLPVGPKETAWRPETGTYDKATLFRSTHQIQARLSGVPSDMECVWAVNDAPTRTSRCAESPKLEIQAGAPFTVTATAANGVRATLQVPKIAERLIVALGDSFASGEGNPDHPAKLADLVASQGWFTQNNAKKFVVSGAQWWDEACHRSLLSWPALAALKQAIENPHEVVQFASFACSGAEVYDGVLRAQADPPGVHAPYLVERSQGIRDGGAGYQLPPGLWNTDPTSGRPQPQDYKKRLPLSQQHALALLMCDERAVHQHNETTLPAMPGLSKDQTYFGEVELYTCETPKRRPDQVLVSIGGNDVGFGPVVKWLLFPPNAGGNMVTHIFRQFGLDLEKQVGHVVAPQDARRKIRVALPSLYDDLARVLIGLHVTPESVTLLQYPDPTLGSPANLDQCNARTRDGNSPFQLFVQEKTHNPNHLFGINKPYYNTVRAVFIQPLQEVQAEAARNLRWQRLDSQPAFARGSAPADYCAVSKACTSDGCVTGDRVRWWTRPAYSDTQQFARLSEFDAYDATRSRGMRYGVDALLTGIGIQEGSGLPKVDWISGSAHPTANVHARIADRVSPWRGNPIQASTAHETQ